MSDEKDATTQLAENSTLIDFESAKGTMTWDAAKTEGQNSDMVEREGLGRFGVTMPEDDPAEVLLVKSSDDEFAGGCLCKENRTHTRPCRHLCTLRIEDAMGDVEVPVSGDYTESLAFQTAAKARDGPEAQSEDAQAGESASGGSEGDGPSETPEVQEQAHATPEPPQRTDDAFANPLPEVDDKFVIEMDGSNYVRKAGYARLLRQQGWEVGRDVVLWSHESEEKRAVVEARIVDPKSGRVIAEALGTSGPPEAEDMSGAEYNLDELAETRAWTRAASIATGEGMTALSEVHPDKEVSGGA